MLNKIKKPILFLLFLLGVTLLSFFKLSNEESLPLVAIANYGPHASLDEAIQGIKDSLAKKGFIEHKTVNYVMADVGFDASLIPQMIATLKNKHPEVMVVITTPVAQFAKGAIKDVPLIYAVITDPIEAGLIQDTLHADLNMTGSSDKQDLNILLQFAKRILPNAQTIGLLYATSEANDRALHHAMQKSAKLAKMKLLALPVSEARDVPLVMQQLKGKVDVLYVGASGPIQPTLPVISAISKQMRIPVLNVDKMAVKEGQVLGNFGVDYYQVGVHAGDMVASVLISPKAALLPPVFPSPEDHRGFINLSVADELGLAIPSGLTQVTLVE